MIKKLNILKLVTTNLVVFIVLIIFGEISYRSLRVIKSCFSGRGSCNYSFLTPRKFPKNTYGSKYGYYRTDNLLGTEVKSNVSVIVNEKEISTLSNGLRKTIPNNYESEKVLTIGDSFAFGGQVSDSETWQSCLNKNIKEYNFLNAGVGGYGTGQAILRAKKLYPKINPKYLLVQTLVGHNFARDQLKRRYGNVKPYFSKVKNERIKIVPPEFDNENKKSALNKIIGPIADHIIVNITILERFSSDSFLNKLWHKSRSKFTPISNIWGKNHASIQEIMRWSIQEAKSLDSEVVWLLQYTKRPTMQTFRERKNLINLLQDEGIRYIDTFDKFHGKSKTNLPKSQLWFPHHTPLGNEIVCREIVDSNIYK